MSDLAMILRRGYAGLQRYLPPYNRGRTPETLDEAGALLLARLLFVRGLEVRGLEQPQLAPLLRGWQRIGRRRDLLGLLAGLAKTLQRLYGGPLLAPAVLDQLECEPTPVEPLLEALLDERLSATLCDPLAVAAAWERAFAGAAPAAARPRAQASAAAGSGVTSAWAPEAQALAAVLDLAQAQLGRSDPAPLVVDLGGGAGAQAALLLGRRLEELAVAAKRAPNGSDVLEALSRLRVVEPASVLRYGALLSLALAALRVRVRLPNALPIGAAPAGGPFDLALLSPRGTAAALTQLEQAAAQLKPAGALGLLLPASAALAQEWEPLRRALFAGWALQTIALLEGALAVVARPEQDGARRDSARIRLATLGPAPEARKRARAGSASGPEQPTSRSAAGDERLAVRVTATALRQGALAALPDAALRLELTEGVERALAKVAAGRPLEEVALIWRVRAGAPAPERGASARRVALPKVLVTAPGVGALQTTVVEGWPEQGGLAVQPLAQLASEKGSGVRLSDEERAQLAPYTPALLAALLASRALAQYRRLLGSGGALGLDELRRLPLPRLDPTDQELPALLEAVGAGARDERRLAVLYGLTAEDLLSLGIRG